jgi:hypothetical protein
MPHSKSYPLALVVAVISQATMGAAPTEQAAAPHATASSTTNESERADNTHMWSFFREVHIREVTKSGDGMALLTRDVGLPQPVAVNLLDYIQQSSEGEEGWFEGQRKIFCTNVAQNAPQSVLAAELSVWQQKNEELSQRLVEELPSAIDSQSLSTLRQWVASWSKVEHERRMQIRQAAGIISTPPKDQADAKFIQILKAQCSSRIS